MNRTEEREDFPTQTDHPQRIFSDAVICFSPAICPFGSHHYLVYTTLPDASDYD